MWGVQPHLEENSFFKNPVFYFHLKIHSKAREIQKPAAYWFSPQMAAVTIAGQAEVRSSLAGYEYSSLHLLPLESGSGSGRTGSSLWV